MYHLSNKQTVQVSKSPLASGGEGGVYSIVGENGRVAKIYFPKNRTQERHKKLTYMVNNAPLKNAKPQYQKSVVWPIDILYDEKGKFVGYIMPKVDSGVELGYFTVFMRNPKVKAPNWDKLCFHPGPEFFYRRMMVCYNLCKAIELVHSKKEYQLCDLKPSNVMIDDTGFVSVIDMDSIQINSGQSKFLSALYTPEYTSPEFIKNRKANRSNAYDHFSLGVILYQLVVGVHPFQGILMNSANGSLTENIKSGACAVGSGKRLFSKIPRSHDVFNYLPAEVQDGFVKTFDGGHTDPPQRLSAKEWAQIFKSVIARNQQGIKQQQTQFKKINKPQPVANQPTPKRKRKTTVIQRVHIRQKAPIGNPIAQRPPLASANQKLQNPMAGITTPVRLTAKPTPLVTKITPLYT